MEAMKLRFAMIDVKKSQGALNKKNVAAMSIRNEIKLITASDEVHGLWKEVISSNSQGLLIDPESLLPFKDSKNWDGEKDGVLSREFFKWLGNTSENNLKRLALHILNRTPRRLHPHPKVTVKKIAGVVIDCMSAKDWLERNKRKQAVRKYLYFENRNLKFFDNNGVYRKEMWKEFKKNYNITKATKQLLITAPKEDFFSVVKRPSAKNKNAQKISPYAAEFFKVFFKKQGAVQEAGGQRVP
jgi:hypothetical protein